MDMVELVEEIIGRIQVVDEEWGHIWKRGTVQSCLDYAVTESAEILDAIIRSERTEDSRNNEKDLSVEKEAADTVMMLCKALYVSRQDGLRYEDQSGRAWGPVFDPQFPYDVIVFCSDAAKFHKIWINERINSDLSESVDCLFDALYELFAKFEEWDIDVVEVVQGNLDNIAAKSAKKEKEKNGDH